MARLTLAALTSSSIDTDRVFELMSDAPRAGDAIEFLLRTIPCATDHPKLWYRLGFLIHRHTGHVDAARVALSRAIELLPTSGPAYSELSIVALRDLAQNLEVRRSHRDHAEITPR